MLIAFSSSAQQTEINVRHLTVKEGLTDGVVRAIGQDKYGYIWIGTISGLNRFDGKNVKSFQTEPSKKNSPPASVPRQILGDSKGNLWIGFNRGLYRFNFTEENFTLVKGTEKLSINKIREDSINQCLYLLTGNGLARYNMVDGKIVWPNYTDKFPGLMPNNSIKDFDIKSENLYISNDTSCVIVNMKNNQTQEVPRHFFKGLKLSLLVADKTGAIWFGVNAMFPYLLRINPSLDSAHSIPLRSDTTDIKQGNSIFHLLCDQDGKIWATTNSRWLYSYDPKADFIQWFRSSWDRRSNTVSLYLTSPLFQSRNGYMWQATEGYGVDYFHPQNKPFKTISPYFNFDLKFNSPWARVALEDNNGNIWMGWGSGLTMLNTKTNQKKSWTNTIEHVRTIYNNSIRSLAQDVDGSIWIGTSRGVNRYNGRSDILEFYTEKDSLPEGFYWSIFKDSQSNIWFGNGKTLFYKQFSNGKISSIRTHNVLKHAIDSGVRVIFEDRQHRIWFGMDGSGLVMYNPASNSYKKWQRENQNDSTLIGNTITGITEDKDGKIWVTSFNGLTMLDIKLNLFRQYSRSAGLLHVKCSAILCDSLNQLWIGTAGGLTMLDPGRKRFTNYTTEDGLPQMEFSDMPGTVLRNGEFLMPTIEGYVQFNPLKIKNIKDSLIVFISEFKVYENIYKTSVNIEEIKSILLKPSENFFTFNLVALNYNNPSQTWFSYKLEGFDQDWIVSRTGIANYTNVPGGDYIFRYKVSNDSENWSVLEKQLSIHINTHFYKSTWFWILISLLLITYLYFWYRARLSQQLKFYTLQSKAQNLEKEKAVAMYESLKQQLNPHFLFNSLSSLGSLIRTDQKLAAGFLDSLSKIYRYILQSRDNDLISLDDEVRFVSSYIRLLETRFQSGLQVDIEVAPQSLARKIVPVTLQHLIDNAIKHNMIDIDLPLRISIFSEGDYLVVRNNKQLLKMVDSSNKQGLLQMKSLYRYMTSNPIIIEESEQVFLIKIPLI